MNRFFLPSIAVALGFATALAFTHSSRAYAAPQKAHKVAICHGTASAKNPYVLIIVDESAKPAHLGGHGQNNAPDFILNNGEVLTPEQEDYYRSLDDEEACGTDDDGGGPGS